MLKVTQSNTVSSKLSRHIFEALVKCCTKIVHKLQLLKQNTGYKS